jgi:hypothetical protein
MAKFEARVPKQNDTVTVAGRTGSFAVIGIDAINKTVELRAIAEPTAPTAPTAIAFFVPWAIIAHVPPPKSD